MILSRAGCECSSKHGQAFQIVPRQRTECRKTGSRAHFCCKTGSKAHFCYKTVPLSCLSLYVADSYYVRPRVSLSPYHRPCCAQTGSILPWNSGPNRRREECDIAEFRAISIRCVQSTTLLSFAHLDFELTVSGEHLRRLLRSVTVKSKQHYTLAPVYSKQRAFPKVPRWSEMGGALL